MKGITRIAVCAMIGLVGLAAAGRAYPVTVVDDRGAKIAFANRPERIVSIGTLYTEILLDLGAVDRLVAVAESPDNPPAVADLPTVGSSFAPNVEVILSFKPDLVLGATDWGGERPALEKAGVVVLTTRLITSLPDLFTTIRTVGKAIGLWDEAEILIGQIAEAIIDIESIALKSSRVKAAFLYAGTLNAPPYAGGSGTIEHELILRAGGENVFADVVGFPQVSFEALLTRNPDVIFTDPAQITNIADNPLLRGVSAVRNNRIYGIKASHVTSTKVAAVLKIMRELLHPEDQ